MLNKINVILVVACIALGIAAVGIFLTGGFNTNNDLSNKKNISSNLGDKVKTKKQVESKTDFVVEDVTMVHG